MILCSATTIHNEPCQARALGNGLCFWHDPAHAEAVKLARIKGGKTRTANLKPATLPEDSEKPCLESAADVARALAQLYQETRTGKIGVSVSNACGVILGTLLRALEQGATEIRIKRLEKRLKRAG